MRDAPYPATIKTSAPSLDGVIERPRLIDALSKLPAPSKWLQAPSGSGKSTLAASYARSTGKRLAWYRLDERDNDPAFFFDEFARSVGAQLSLSDALPQFSGDDHARVAEFARRFVISVSKQLKKPALLVIDDVQHLESEEMQAALAALVTVAAKGSEMLFVSQSTAPTAFFDAIAARQLSLLNDADLNFSSAECKAMTASLRVADAHCEEIATLTGGHAGALVLACELLRSADPKSALGAATVERIHLHLLTKLIDRMPAARRELVLQTAFVGQLTRPIAEALAGPDAAGEIDGLADSGLLRQVGTGSDEVFEAHGLVRQGVQTLVRARIGQIKARALADRTATVLSGHDQREAAFALLAEIGSTTQAIEELRSLAEHYARLGQSDLLLNSIAKLRSTEVNKDPWLCFWTGQALLQINEEQARVWFAHSYTAFESACDTAGMRLAAASIVTAFGLECADVRELDKWMELHRQAGGDTTVTANERFEASLLMGIMCAAFVTAGYPTGMDVEALIARVRTLLEEPSRWLSSDQRVQAARLLIEHGNVFSKLPHAHSVVVATTGLIRDATGGALHRGRWLIAAAVSYLTAGESSKARGYLEQARQVANERRLPQLTFELELAFANHLMKSHDLDGAQKQVHLLELLATQAAPGQRADHARMEARLHLLRGRVADGLRWAEEALRLAKQAGYAGSNLRVFEIERTYALAANQRFNDALAVISVCDFEPQNARLAIENCLRFFVSDDLDALRDGLSDAASVGFINLLDRAREPLAILCETALAEAIQTDFVLRIIALKKLQPPLLARATWPWPVRIKCLGSFELYIGQERYRPTHKAQDKPLELLKLLVAVQASGRESAEKVWISERLWPDATAENARKSLDMTVARLRRLLADDEAVPATEGRLQLSATKVWTDVRLLRSALSTVQARRDSQVAQSGPLAHSARTGVSAVLHLYNGPFLADEEGAPWLLAAREAVTSLVRRALFLADAILNGEADEILIPALQRAIDVDPTSEDLARALMRAHLRQGETSNAIRVYRRLRQMLSVMLSVAPSKESDEIRDLAYASDRARAEAPSD